MSKKYIWSIIVGLIVLIVPTTIYLIFLVPQLTERYNVLMSSAGVLGSFGYISASKLPEKFKYSKLLKTSVNSFTTLVVMTLVQEFAKKIIFLALVLIVSFIIFEILKGVYNDGKRKYENRELANEISRSINENAK